MLTALYFTLLGTLSTSAQSIEAKFSTEKANYLVGEPLFVTLVVSNRISEPIWLDFQSPDLAKVLCDDFAVEVPGAEPAELWGCGFAGSCGRGLTEVQPGKSTTWRQLVNQQFRLQAGAFSLHAQTSISVRKQDLWDSPEIEHVTVSDTLQVKVQPGSRSGLESAFKPIVAELDDPDPLRRAEAAAAVTALAPAFLEDTLIELTNTKFSGAAVVALRKADTPKTRAALARIARSSDTTIRIAAIDNLGRTRDVTYLPLLFQLMDSDNKEIQNAAAEAAGNLGGSTAVPQLANLISSLNAATRLAGTNGLGRSHANEAVPLLIGVLVDSDDNVRQAAVSGLWVVTHRAAFDGNQWADVKVNPPLQSSNGGRDGGVLTGRTIKPMVWLIAPHLSRLTDSFQTTCLV
jgi:hypothetical protein